uniref:Uncharacterized protein n=2 Tax=Caenorhabditis tropicalis TaxID=1561998 RepID=A0A1I7U6M3_9PELO
MFRLPTETSMKISTKNERAHNTTPLNKSYFDERVLESAANKILRIVHPGRSERDRMKRDENRDKIKSHVLRVMEPIKKTEKSLQFNYRDQIMPVSSQLSRRRTDTRENMKNRSNFSEKLNRVVSKEVTMLKSVNPSTNGSVDEVHKPSFNGKDRNNSNCISNSKKKVSFISPPHEESKRTRHFIKITNERRKAKKRSLPAISNVFRTPPKMKNSCRFSQPPPLINVKRGFIVTDSPGKLIIEPQSTTSGPGALIKIPTTETKSPVIEEKQEAHRKETTPEGSIGNVSVADYSVFDLESILKTPIQTEKPYDLLGLTDYVDKIPPVTPSLLF